MQKIKLQEKVARLYLQRVILRQTSELNDRDYNHPAVHSDRYCECFASGVQCGAKCKCRKCKNMGPNRQQAESMDAAKSTTNKYTNAHEFICFDVLCSSKLNNFADACISGPKTIQNGKSPARKRKGSHKSRAHSSRFHR